MSYPSYPEYKSAVTHWVQTVPSHWEVAPVRSFVNERNRKNHEEQDDNYLSLMANVGVIPYAEKGDVGNKKPDDLSRCKIVKKGDLLLNSMNYGIGSYGISPYDGVCSPVYIILTPIAEKANSRHALRIFENKEFQKLAQSFGQGILSHRAAIGWEDIKNLKVPLPPLEEQTQIARFLDHQTARIDALIAEQQRLIELLKEKRQTVISHAVTKGLAPDVAMKDSGVQWLGQVPEHWEVVKLRWLARLNSGEGITTESIETEGEYPVYGGNGVRGYTEQFTHYGIHVLIGRQGALCGNINYADGRFWASEHAVVVTPTRDLDPVWLGETLRYMDLNQYSISAAQPGLAVDRVSGLQVPVPPKWEQSKIAEVLDEEIAKVRNLIDVAVQGIEILRERRSALISAAVTGKIDVRDWEPPVSQTFSQSTASEEAPA